MADGDSALLKEVIQPYSPGLSTNYLQHNIEGEAQSINRHPEHSRKRKSTSISRPGFFLIRSAFFQARERNG
ncbi:hypothetical protein BTJ40_11680 [Microbulbifer sp. A4B17]|nr:hypothetical protein BTJ40_11680 [Microbulbifer sp. A4B17]